jgi:O-antigen biosynthesis protein
VSTVCYTALYGDYDRLRAAPDVTGVQFVAFTDDEDLVSRGWEVRVVPAPADEHPRMTAKRFKLLPHIVLPDAERTVWVDASHEICGPTAVLSALACLDETGIALHRHPVRDCIYVEAEHSLWMLKYKSQPISEQVERYRAEGHPEHWGLWACGSMARTRGAIDAVMDDWWAENLAWSYQDQISFPVVMRRAGLRPAEFPHYQLSSPWFIVGGHTRDD